MARTLQELCALYGGHVANPKRPAYCIHCGKQLRPVSPEPPEASND